MGNIGWKGSTSEFKARAERSPRLLADRIIKSQGTLSKRKEAQSWKHSTALFLFKVLKLPCATRFLK